MTRAEVYPFLDMTELKSSGKLIIDGRMFNDTCKLILDFIAADLRSFIDFPNVEEYTWLVEPSVIEVYYQNLYGVKTMSGLLPQFKLWFQYTLERLALLCPQELVNSLGHYKLDAQSKSKFREGWISCVEIVKTYLLSKTSVDVSKGQLLLEDPRNSFLDTIQARWDAEKGELVRETQKLRVELGKAQDQAAELEEKSKNLQQEKELLKEEFNKQKEEFEA
ncbi:hypothetical protein R1sor_012191 [Riccia sorocarpa]|uniref:Uncharacterized protein n=1 Tax=Riccia sorocarpa TaxID=122646 RepID=A0ABD3I330_9MARC